MTININVADKRASVIGAPVIVCGNSDYSVRFTFDEAWADLEYKTARFVYVKDGAVHHTDVPFEGDTASVPVLSNIKEVSIGVFAGNLYTTSSARVPCKRSIRCGSGEPADPTPSQYDQIMELLNAKDTPGANNEVSGEYGFASGYGNTVEGDGAFASGRENQALGEASHAQGNKTLSKGEYSHAQGNESKAYGESAHAEGNKTTAYANYSHAEGGGSITGVDASDLSVGRYSHAEGSSTVASGIASHAQGNKALAKGKYSHAQGNESKAYGESAHAEGNKTVAYANYSHAEGGGSVTGVDASDLSVGRYSHAEGSLTKATGIAAHAEGNTTIAGSDFQHVQGKYNVPDRSNTYAHIVGNGSSEGKRSNAHTLDWEGNAWYAGDVLVGADRVSLLSKIAVLEEALQSKELYPEAFSLWNSDGPMGRPILGEPLERNVMEPQAVYRVAITPGKTYRFTPTPGGGYYCYFAVGDAEGVCLDYSIYPVEEYTVKENYDGKIPAHIYYGVMDIKQVNENTLSFREVGLGGLPMLLEKLTQRVEALEANL